jgi:hypothetical protein
MVNGMQKPATVGTSLNAVSAADTPFRVNEHNSFFRVVCGADRTDLFAWRLLAMVAHFGNKKCF